MSTAVDSLPSLLFVILPPITSAAALVPVVLFIIATAALISPGGIAWSFTRKNNPIPGPGGLAAGVALAGAAAHRALAGLSRRFSSVRLMAFSVGFTRFIVSSHPETAREILNSSAFADRPIKESARELLFHRAMGFAPFGEYWRNLRRISSTHLFCPKRIAAFGDRRREIGEKMVEDVRILMGKHGEVEVKRVLHFGALNNVMVSVFGKSFDFWKGEGLELEEMVKEGYELLGGVNWSDHLPFIGWMDLQGVRRRSRVLVKKVDVFVGKIIEEHRMRRVGESKRDKGEVGDFVDVLLDLEKEDKLSDSDMVAVLWEMIFRGTDTVSIILEWILARMILHPEIQAKAQDEIETFVGNSRAVTDSDIPNLKYLQSIVKESLRMHPPGPLLSWARLAIHDTHVGNHLIPGGTTAMVNMWAITHDESIWADPCEFKPERFMEEEDVSIMGSDLRLAPFGSGRRVCPGKAMGLATVHLWLAQMLQSFKWVPSTDGVSLSECLKMSLEMEHPLVCCAIPRV